MRIVYTFLLVFLFAFDLSAQDETATEAKRFAEESRFLNKQGKLAEAMEKIEVAIALDSDNLSYRRDFIDLLEEQVKALISPRRKSGGEARKTSAEEMRQAVADALRLEALVDAFPRERFGYFKQRNSYMYFRYDMYRLANESYPEHKETIRQIDFRALEHWLNHIYRPSVTAIVDQESFRKHFRTVGGYVNTFGLQSPETLIPLYEELIGNTLRLSLQYELEENEVDPHEISDTRSISELCLAFAREAAKYRQSPKNDVLDSDHAAGASLRRCIDLLNNDPRPMIQVFGWLAENKMIVPHDTKATKNEKQVYVEYYESVRTYLQTLPRETPCAVNEPLYNELSRCTSGRLEGRAYMKPEKPLQEIIELANARGEYCRAAVNDLLFRLTVLSDNEKQPPGGPDPEGRNKELLLVQWETLRRIGHQRAAESMKNSLVKLGFIPGRKNPIKPWAREIPLFVSDDRQSVSVIHQNTLPIIHSQTLYFYVWFSRERVARLASIDLSEAIEGRPTVHYGPDLPYNPVLRYVDDRNVYVFNKSEDKSGHWPKGLYVYPRDGSPFWRLTLEDGLPSDNVIVYGSHKEKLYACLDGGGAWIIRIDLDRRDWEILSSTRAKTGRTPFVDGRGPGFNSFCDDPRRHRILLGSHGGSLYAFDLNDERFVPLGHSSGCGMRILGFIPGTREILLGSCNLFTLDLEQTYDSVDKKSIAGYNNISLPRPMRMGDYAAAATRGFVWGGLSTGSESYAWNRCALEGPLELEPLAVPDAIEEFSDVKREKWFPSHVAATSDGKGLVVASYRQITLLCFE